MYSEDSNIQMGSNSSRKEISKEMSKRIKKTIKCLKRYSSVCKQCEYVVLIGSRATSSDDDWTDCDFDLIASANTLSRWIKKNKHLLRDISEVIVVGGYMCIQIETHRNEVLDFEVPIESSSSSALILNAFERLTHGAVETTSERQLKIFKSLNLLENLRIAKMNLSFALRRSHIFIRRQGIMKFVNNCKHYTHMSRLMRLVPNFHEYYHKDTKKDLMKINDPRKSYHDILECSSESNVETTRALETLKWEVEERKGKGNYVKEKHIEAFLHLVEKSCIDIDINRTRNFSDSFKYTSKTQFVIFKIMIDFVRKISSSSHNNSFVLLELMNFVCT